MADPREEYFADAIDHGESDRGGVVGGIDVDTQRTRAVRQGDDVDRCRGDGARIRLVGHGRRVRRSKPCRRASTSLSAAAAAFLPCGSRIDA